MWRQKQIYLQAKKRGFHLVTEEIVSQLPELKEFQVGVAHFFIRHTSAGLTLNENADRSVRIDMAAYFDRLAPENQAYFTHTLEGTDDMPAHLKSVLSGCELTVPISNGRLLLGTWQGIYLCEFRNSGGKRSLIVTLNGESQRTI
ncbi:MAG: secondary thiamine-phosphate synthase enzyme YjbQ [Gammaproteobacteria bacterium]